MAPAASSLTGPGFTSERGKAAKQRLELLKHYALPAVVLGLIFSSYRSLPAPAGNYLPDSKTASAASSPDLKTVMAGLDKNAPGFKSAKADFEWIHYSKTANKASRQTGQLSVRRAGKDMDVTLQLTSNIIGANDAQTQTTTREISENRPNIESFLSLGFGAGSQDLLNSFDVTMTGWDTVDNVKTAKLELVGRNDQLKPLFSKAVLWIDPAKAIPVKQQCWQPSGDYQLVSYSNIKLNAPVDDLNAVLAEMDKTAPRFKSAQADVELVQYTRAVEEKDTQTGKVFVRRSGKDGKDMDFALHVLTPHARLAIVKDGKLTYRDPKTNQTTVRDIGKNRGDVEAYMSLGFGSRGQDLLKYYDVTMTGWETVDNVKTARLELVGKSDRLKQFFSKMILWIDPVQSIPLKQQRLQSSGDYQLIYYTNIKLNDKVSDDAFSLKGNP